MAEKRVQELLGQMQKTLECSICLDMMNNPVSTGCGHQFCRFCLTEFIDRKRHVPCPLCKKPITKRSLMSREELGDMVEGVRSLISAFQKDTGLLFSPPRGPQTGLLPGTPESIKAKTTARQKPGKKVTPSNVRCTKRRQPKDIASTDSPSIAGSGSDPSHNVENSDNDGRNTAEDIRHQKLLKCIQEGTLNADDSNENVNDEESRNTSKLKTKIKSSLKKCPKRKTGNSGRKPDLTENETETVVVNQSVDKPVGDEMIQENTTESGGKRVNEAIVRENKGNEDNEVRNQVDMEVETDIPILSLNSVGKESENSSGPLFRTPLDPNNSKHCKRGNDLVDNSEENQKRSLRSKDKKTTNNELEVSDDDDSSLKLTQEELTVKGKDSSRTYGKKDKDLFGKEKKATRKVAEWLKNIPPITNSASLECNEISQNEPKERNQPKRMSKKDIKVRQEEEAMGSRIKHLAKHVQDNSKGLLFEVDDFETEKNAETDSEIKGDIEDVSVALENATETNLDRNDGVSSMLWQEIKPVIMEPVKRRRIFKSRTHISGVNSQIDSEQKSSKNSSQNVSVTKSLTEESNASNVSSNENVEIQSQDSELPASDPYEFKSSQNTPMKVTKKKGKSKKIKQTKALKGKQMDIRLENVIRNKNLEKVWDRGLLPVKKILKTAKQIEIDILNANLMQAEDYDLLTCTQEAAESIDKENLNLKTSADRKNVNSEINTQKKVRFTEPVISDFIQSGKINIIGYRKAKKELDEIKNKKNIKGGDEREAINDVENKQKEKVVKYSECPVKPSNGAADCESDDLSEDYRFQDDSSGTDDLDIEPTQDQFEKPNIEIQPEEIKAKLSQENDLLQEKVVQEMPLIPRNLDQPDTNIIEETPALFSVPKFNKNLSRPAGKTRKTTQVKTPILPCKSETVPETPVTEIDKHDDSAMSVESEKEAETAELNKTRTKESIVATEQSLKANSEIGINLVDGSDETISPDADLTDIQVVNTEKPEKIDQMQVDDNEGDLAEKHEELVSNESSLTQNSESILQIKPVQNQISSANDEQVKVVKESDGKNEIDQGINEINIDNKDDGDCSIINTEFLQKTKSKRKRKSFMLDEGEESLDFGSLSAFDHGSVSEEAECVSKAKRQRVNRLKRSPKINNKIKEIQKCQNQENNLGVLSSVDIIPDTMNFENKNITHIISIDSDKVNLAEITKLQNESENNDGEVITLSSESGSILSIEGDLKEKMSNLRTKNTDNIPEQKISSNMVTTDVIGETEREDSEKAFDKNKDNGNSKNDAGLIEISDNLNGSDCLKSPKSSRKRKSRQHDGSRQSSQNSVDRVRHFSGILASPQYSLNLSGVKCSPEDIFKMDSEMPSVDLSPNEESVAEEHKSQSLDLGTLLNEDPQLNNAYTLKRTRIDEVELDDKSENNLINIDGEKSYTEGLASEKNSNCRHSNIGLDSTPNSGEAGRKVKGVRGFAKRRKQTAVEQSQKSSNKSENLVNAVTPLSHSSVKYKSPVVKFSSPSFAKAVQSEIIDTEELNKDNTNAVAAFLNNSPKENLNSKEAKEAKEKEKERKTPVKILSGINSLKYSPKSTKKLKEKEETTESKVEVEVVELKNEDDDESLLSPADLPDIANCPVHVNKMDEDVDYTKGGENDVKISKRSKVSPQLILSSPDKRESNIVLKGNHQGTPKRIENEEKYKTVIPETMFSDNDDDVDDDNAVLDGDSSAKEHDKLTELELDKEDGKVRKDALSDDDVENGISSSTSSEFRLDSSDERSVENEALNEISKFDEIVQNSIDIKSLTRSKDLKKNNVIKNKDDNVNHEKKKKQNDFKSDINESFEKCKTLGEGELKRAEENPKNIVDKNVIDVGNMYSSKLDSSSDSIEALNENEAEESEPVILESDIDDEVEESVKDDVECINDKQNLKLVGEDETEKEMEEDSDDDIRIKSGRKRAILSDSSSEEEEEESRHMNLTSSSAFSSQSENLTTQERLSLEKEVERMAREMAAMKEQLRKSREMNKTKKPDKKCIKIDESDDDMPDIEHDDSDNGEEDLFMSPPAINPGDLDLNDDEKLDQTTAQESQNHDEDLIQVEESPFVHEESFTVPESDTSQVSQSVLQKPESSDISDATIPKSEENTGTGREMHKLDDSKALHQVLSDLDTNVMPSTKLDSYRQVGIVVTGLDVQQIQKTKKLAALTNAKFFTKFNDSVTHVVVKPADEDDFICDRTLKFFQGIARKCWIVNFFWVVDSREIGQLLPEGPYEIQGDTTNNQAHFGPKKSRLSKDHKLFQKFQFSLIGDNTYLSKDSMCDLIETCGGDVVEIMKQGRVGKTQLVISCTDIDDDEEDVQSIIKHAREVYKRQGIVTLTREWILDSLTLYKIQPLQDYLVTDLPNLKLPKI